MTVISILNGDFEILFDDEKNQNGGSNAVAGMRTVRKAVVSPTVITTNTLYSAIAAISDDFIAMGFTNPMSPTTPNAYTMENNYFIPRSTTEFLKEGAIDAAWALSTPESDTNGHGVLKVVYSGGTNFVLGDIGRQVIQADSTDSGTLLDFDVDPDGTLAAWIRPDDSTPVTGDIFDGTGALSVVADSGTGVSTASVAGVSGTTRYPAVQVIGSIPTATEVYLYQNRLKMTDSTGGFQWWSTDTTASLGIISILVRVQDMGTLVADGDVEVFARKYTSQYANFRLNVSAGGFSALPLASSPDINNTTGYRKAFCSSGVSDFDVGNAIYVGATFATATKKGVITAVTGTVADPDIEYYLIGDLTDFVAVDAIKEFDFATQADGDGTATVDSVAANLTGPTDTAAGEGGTVTLALGGFLVDHTGDGTTEPYSIQVDAQGDVPIAKVYERVKYITRRGATETDLFGAGVNVPGESYRGLDAIFEYDANTGSMTESDDVFTTTGGSTWTARLLHQNSTEPSGTYISVTDQQTSIDSVVDNNVIEDEAGAEDITVHAGGTNGIQNFTSPQSSPLGTFTGTQIFGARGVSYVNFAPADTQAYILTDDLGILNSPPNTISFIVANTIALDRILAARDTGTAGVIDKDQFGGLAAPAGAFNGLDDIVIRVAGSIDTEVPQSGYVRVVDTGLRQEHHYVYDSRTTGALGEFNLRDVNEGTSVTTASSTNLIDTSATFLTAPVVEVGMLIRNTFAGKTTHIWEVTAVNSTTDLSVVILYGPGGATQDWDVGDTYSINRLIGDHTGPGDYAATDDVYDLILDTEATGTSVNNTFIKNISADFGVVVNVRQGKIILPFTQNPTQSDGSTTITVVRQPDTIAV